MRDMGGKDRTNWRTYLLTGEKVDFCSTYKFYNISHLCKAIGLIMAVVMLYLFDFPLIPLLIFSIPMIIISILFFILFTEKFTDAITDYRFIRARTNKLNLFEIKSYNYNHIDSTQLSKSWNINGKLLAGGIVSIILGVFILMNGFEHETISLLLIILGIILVASAFRGWGYFAVLMDSGEIVPVKKDRGYVDEFSTHLIGKIRNIEEKEDKIRIESSDGQSLEKERETDEEYELCNDESERRYTSEEYESLQDSSEKYGKFCPECGESMRFIEGKNEWFCDNCREYKLSKEETKRRNMSKNQSKKHLQQSYVPENQERTKEKLCPICGERMQFVEEYQRWYCYNCEKYETNLRGRLNSDSN